MNTRYFCTFLILLAASASAAAPPALFPVPKQVTWLGSPAVLQEGSVAVVVGGKATEPERYAAEAFCRCVRKRFGQSLPIVSETADTGAFKTVIVLGQRQTCRLADRLCSTWKLKLNADSPGWDGYIIHVGSREGRTYALVGGSTPRGVVYGQDTLFQMLRMQDGRLTLWPASVRDWPSVKWRGRPHSDVAGYERKNTFDSFVQGRVNFVDLRFGKRIYGTPPDHEIDTNKALWVLREAHRRGLFVFATVDCAVPREQHDLVIKKYEELLDLGADGIYISIDDPGAEYRYGTSFDLLRRIVDLGRKRGITGDRLAMVPGKESYSNLSTEVNYKTGHLDGLQEVLLFVTTLPSRENLKKHLANGFTTPPSWWNNGPRPRGGFGHIGNRNMRLDGRLPYMWLSPLSEGWRNPSWESLRSAGETVRGVMPWGASVWGNEYVAHVMCMWAWNPEGHDWSEHRARIYDIVYGPDLVRTMFEFDDKLEQLERLFIMAPDESGIGRPGAAWSWPPILRNGSDLGQAKSILADLERLRSEIEQKAPAGSLLPDDALRADYLDAMKGELEIAALIIDLPMPEKWWPANESRVAAALKLGNSEQAGKWYAEGRERALREADAVENAFKGLLDSNGYADNWKRRLDSSFAEVRRAQRAPDLKGDLSDPLWRDAAVISFGSGGDRTEVSLLYTDRALYVGFTCFESMMDRLVARKTQRNSNVWEDDSVEVFLNTDAMLYPFFHFLSNSLGTQLEDARQDGGVPRQGWQAEWTARAARFSDRWTVEMEIPFGSLGVESAPTGEIWMANFCRQDYAVDNTGVPFWERSAKLSSYGPSPSGGFHDTRGFRPLWFK